MIDARRRIAFTLVEMLVALSIIALLISLLLPTLRRARESARSIVCVSNLRHIGIGLSVYGADHHDLMPQAMQRGWDHPLIPGLVGGGRGWMWCGILYEEGLISVGEWAELKCPSDNQGFKRPYEIVDETSLYCPPQTVSGADFEPFYYAAVLMGHGLTNRQLPWSLPTSSSPTWPGHWTRIGDMPNPSELNLLWEGKIATWSQGGGWSFAWPNIQAAPPDADNPMFRHQFGGLRWDRASNGLFADGHAVQALDFTGFTEDNFSFPK